MSQLLTLSKCKYKREERVCKSKYKRNHQQHIHHIEGEMTQESHTCKKTTQLVKHMLHLASLNEIL